MRAFAGEVASIELGHADQGGPRTSADRAMERYADGDDSAFATLYDELAPRIHRFALWRVRLRQLADDVVQQTFLHLHRSRHRFIRGAAVLPWAYAIARRAALDTGGDWTWGDQASEPEGGGGEPSGELLADQVLELKEDELAARRALSALPATQREAFQLVKLEELSVAQAAEILGITQGMVKIRTHRAKRALLDSLQRAPLEPSRSTDRRGTRP